MKLYRFNNFAFPTGIHTREDTYYSDYRSSARFIKSYYHSGDLIIVVMPEVLYYYSNIVGDYFVEDYTKRQIFFDPIGNFPRYLEKTFGLPSISSSLELTNVLSKYRRIWVVTAPYSIFAILSGHDVIDYIRKYANVAYESYDTRVYLLQR